MPISVLFVQSEPPPKVLLRSISISIFSQWHSVEAPLGFQADSDSPTLCNWLSSQHHDIWKHQQLQLLSTVHCQAHCTACTVRVQFLGITLHCCCWGFLWWGWATLVLCLADHATHPPVWSQHSPPVQLPCTVYFTKKHIAADWNVLSISAYCSADALLYHYSRFTCIRARTAVLLMPRKNPIRNFDTKAVPARNELCSSSH